MEYPIVNQGGRDQTERCAPSESGWWKPIVIVLQMDFQGRGERVFE